MGERQWFGKINKVNVWPLDTAMRLECLRILHTADRILAWTS